MSQTPKPNLEVLRSRAAALEERYEAIRSRRLALDMTRGKPCSAQLDLSAGLLSCLGEADYRAADGTDCRNYGGLDGLPEARRLFGEVLEVPAESVVVGGNSSLQLMHATVSLGLLFGMPGGPGSWARREGARFLCPSPGYDRHFTVCEKLGIDMVPVDMTDDGPDMEQVARLVRDDVSVVGMWCVPKYSNPTGVTYSDDVVRALASMPTAASDFRLFWDDAYTVHHLYDEPDRLLNVMDACRTAGNPERVFVFASTSKISFAGGGIAAVATGPQNRKHLLDWLGTQTIGPDKVNQLRHVRFFQNRAGVEAHMQRHAAIIRPKFDVVYEVFDRELNGTGAAFWSRPRGGYFISLDVPAGCARKVVQMADEVGVKLTGAGATYPFGRDPHDSNIRIAPTLPSLDEVRAAMEVVAVCVQRAALQAA